MAADKVILRVSRGKSATLPSEITDGQLLFTTDNEKLMVDYDRDGTLSRSVINPNPDWNATSGNAQILNKPTVTVESRTLKMGF